MTAPLHAITQGDMNEMAEKDFEKSERQLNIIYKKLSFTLDARSKQKLLASENAWLAYRRAHAEFEADYVARGGSMAPQIFNMTRTEVTDARIKDLKYILTIVPQF